MKYPVTHVLYAQESSFSPLYVYARRETRKGIERMLADYRGTDPAHLGAVWANGTRLTDAELVAECKAEKLAETVVKLPLTGAEGLAILIGEAIGEDVQTYTRDANRLTVTAQDGCTYGVTVHLIEECIDKMQGYRCRVCDCVYTVRAADGPMYCPCCTSSDCQQLTDSIPDLCGRPQQDPEPIVSTLAALRKTNREQAARIEGALVSFWSSFTEERTDETLRTPPDRLLGSTCQSQDAQQQGGATSRGEETGRVRQGSQ